MERIFMHPAGEAKLMPPLSVDHWLNSEGPLDLRGMRGKVVVLSVFEMDDPDSLRHGLPQAARIREAFDPSDVEVIGLHPGFDSATPMGALTLATFLLEHDVHIPVALDVSIDAAANDSMPTSMSALGVVGTPSLVLIDRMGRLRANVYGRPSDMLVGSTIATLAAEKQARPVVLGRRPRPLTPMDTAFSEGYAQRYSQPTPYPG